MNVQTLCTFLLALMAPIVSVPSALAQDFYVVGENNQFGTLDVHDSEAIFSPLGLTSETLNGLGCAPDGTLYGTDLMPNSNSNLYRVDRSTGTTTLLGSFDRNADVASVGLDGNVWAFDLAGGLYTVNPITLAITDIGSTGFRTDGQPAFDASGLLYATDKATPSANLYLIDPNTAAATRIGDIGFNDFGAMAFCNGTLYVTVNSSNEVLSINTSTGEGTVVAFYQLPLGGDILSGACCSR